MINFYIKSQWAREVFKMSEQKNTSLNAMNQFQKKFFFGFSEKYMSWQMFFQELVNLTHFTVFFCVATKFFPILQIHNVGH